MNQMNLKQKREKERTEKTTDTLHLHKVNKNDTLLVMAGNKLFLAILFQIPKMKLIICGYSSRTVCP